MKRILAFSAIMVFASHAAAADASPPPIPFALTAGDVHDWEQAPQALDKCVSDITLHTNFQQCRFLSTFLVGFGARVSEAATAAIKPRDTLKPDDQGPAGTKDQPAAKP